MNKRITKKQFARAAKLINTGKGCSAKTAKVVLALLFAIGYETHSGEPYLLSKGRRYELLVQNDGYLSVTRHRGPDVLVVAEWKKQRLQCKRDAYCYEMCGCYAFTASELYSMLLEARSGA